MNALCHLIRFLGCSIGLFFVVSGIADVLGFVPYSDETPPWTARLISSAPSMFVGIVLLVPVRYFLRDARFVALACAYGLAIAWALSSAVHGLAAYASGGRHWGIVPTSLVPLGFIAANAAVLLFRRWQATRLLGHSIDPTSFHDAA